MEKPADILKKYWGFDTFRSPQEDIINAVLNKTDVLALLPTGGGKSVCFQVPALLNEGICIVVSPLVALIKDQVNELKNKGIKAIGLTGGLKYFEVDTLLDNCIYGQVKFLYLSPERLQQELVQERIKQMPVSLIAIDEAHCISQWGHDFRPSYRNCASLRDFFPEIPVIALTATATPSVLNDIMENLRFRTSNIIQKPFYRENLAYMVLDAEDKLYKLDQILKKIKGSSIIYVRNRKAASDIALHLNQKGITASFYHGGIMPSEKDEKLRQWLHDEVRVMVATNAFGMGIDKPDVRSVIHLDLPDTIESYYQEAGRAGRDTQKAYAILLKNKADTNKVKKQFLEVWPDVEFIKLLYRKLNNYFQIGYGEGTHETFALNFNQFCQTYKLNPVLTYNAMKLLDQHAILELSETFHKKTQVQFICSNHTLFNYLDKNPRLESVTQAILRTYGGIFDNPIKINTVLLAGKTGLKEEEVLQVLEKLAADTIIEYNAQNTDAEVTFLVPREDDQTINVIVKSIRQQQEHKEKQVQAVIDYVHNDKICRSVQLAQYFGEKECKPCGICSVCTKPATKTGNDITKIIAEQILKNLHKKPASSRELTELLTYREHCVLEALQLLIDQEKIGINQTNEYYIVEK